MGHTWLVNEGVAELLAEYSHPVPAGLAPLAFLSVPFLVDGRKTGKISLQDVDREFAFGDNEIRLLETLAGSLSVALENARLFDEVQQRNREISEALEKQTATSEILSIIASSPTDTHPVMQVIADNARRLLNGLESAVFITDGVMIYEAAQGNFSPQATEALAGSYPRPLDRESSLNARAIVDRIVMNIPDVMADPSLPEVTLRYAESMGFRSQLSVPMIREGIAIGSITVVKAETGLFDEKHVQLLETFADQAVIAIENVRLFTETQRLLKETEQRATELELINNIQQGVAAELDFQSIVDLVGHRLREVFEEGEVGITWYDENSGLMHTLYLYEHGRRIHNEPVLLQDTRLWKQVILNRKSLLFNNPEDRASLNPWHVPGTDIAKSGALVPIIGSDRVIGVIQVESLRAGKFL